MPHLKPVGDVTKAFLHLLHTVYELTHTAEN